MKSKKTVIFACMILALALLSGILLLAKGKLDAVNASAERYERECEAQTCDEDYSVVFYNVNDYVNYVTRAEFAESPYSRNNGTIRYYTPKTLPEGVSLIRIEITDEGIIFDYDVSSYMPRDPSFEVLLGDEAISELISIYRLKYYTGSSYINDVTDKPLYKARLAAAIEATYLGMFDLYMGDVVMSIEQSDHTMQDVIVGRQVLGTNNDGDFQYMFTPVYVPVTVSEALSDMQLNTVTVENH